MRIYGFIFIFSFFHSYTCLNITWISEPVLPGEYALVQISNVSSTDSWFIRSASSSSKWATLNTFSGRNDHGISVYIPASLPVGPFFLRVNDGAEYLVNGPRPWWLFGDSGDSSTLGGYIRVFGLNIRSPTRQVTILKLESESGHVVTLKASSWKANENHAHFDLPHESILPLGEYEVFISNDGGKSFQQPCTFYSIDTTLIDPCYSSWRIEQGTKWSEDIFNVMDYAKDLGLDLPIAGRDFTEAVFKTVDAANANGGGIVYFPRGQYFLYSIPNKTSLEVASGVRLKGAGMKLTAIYFKEQQKDQAPQGLITSTTDDAIWGMEHLSIYVTAFFHFVVYLQELSQGFYMHHVRMRANSYFCHTVKPSPSWDRGRSANWQAGGGTCVGLSGRNIFIEDNDIYCSGSTIGTLNEKGTLQDYMKISRNIFQHGGLGHWGIYWKYIINEDNMYSGVGITAMGSNYCQYGGANPNVYNIFHDNNTMVNVWGNDREMMTTDEGGGSYYGPVDMDATSLTKIKLYSAAPKSVPYFNNLCIVDGSGTGQCRRIIENVDNRTFIITRPFTHPLDSSSMVTILPYLGQFIFTNNYYADGGSIQTYNQAFDWVFANNTLERMGGLYAWGRFGVVYTQAYNINFRLQFLRNHFLEGNHVWNYNTNGDWRYHVGGEKLVDPWNMGILGPTESDYPLNQTYTWNGAMNRFIVFRENRFESNGGIRVAGNTSNVLIEGNVITDSDIGIHINRTCFAFGGIVMVNNSEPPNVPPNFSPYAPYEELQPM